MNVGESNDKRVTKVRTISLVQIEYNDGSFDLRFRPFETISSADAIEMMANGINLMSRSVALHGNQYFSVSSQDGMLEL